MMTNGIFHGDVYYETNPGSWGPEQETKAWIDQNYNMGLVSVDKWFLMSNGSTKLLGKVTGIGTDNVFFSTTAITVHTGTQDTDQDGVINSEDADPCDDQVQTIQQQDADNDGIPDQNDPFPNDDRPFTWEVIMHCLDDQGAIIGYTMEIDNGDGPQRMTVGETDCADFGVFPAGTGESGDTDDWMTFADGSSFNLLGQDTTPYYGDDSPNYADDFAGVPDTPATGIETGEGSDAGDTDSDYLRKIVDNTKKLADNDQALADQLKAQNERLTESREMSQEQLTQQQKIQNELEEMNDDSNATISDDGTGTVQSAYDAALSDINSDLSIDENYQTRTDLDVELDSRITAPGVLDMVTGVQVQASGSCSFTANLLGRDVDFTICAFEDELQQWGVILQMLTALSSILVVFKRS